MTQLHRSLISFCLALTVLLVLPVAWWFLTPLDLDGPIALLVGLIIGAAVSSVLLVYSIMSGLAALDSNKVVLIWLVPGSILILVCLIFLTRFLLNPTIPVGVA